MDYNYIWCMGIFFFKDWCVCQTFLCSLNKIDGEVIYLRFFVWNVDLWNHAWLLLVFPYTNRIRCCWDIAIMICIFCFFWGQWYLRVFVAPVLHQNYASFSLGFLMSLGDRLRLYQPLFLKTIDGWELRLHLWLWILLFFWLDGFHLLFGHFELDDFNKDETNAIHPVCKSLDHWRNPPV